MESSIDLDETYIHNLSIFYGLDKDDEHFLIALSLLFTLLIKDREEDKQCTETITDKICDKQI